MKKMIIALFLIATGILYSKAFEKITVSEEKIFGFTLEESGSFSDRLDIVEEKLFGEKSEDPDIIREKKIYDTIFLEESYYSTIKKIARIEKFLFEKVYLSNDILSRLERIEEYIYHDVNNQSPVVDRINKVYTYLLLENMKFQDEEKFVSEINNAVVKMKGKKKKYKEGEKLKFYLINDAVGVMEKGSIVYGKIVDDGSIFRIKNKKLKIQIYKIVNKKNENIDVFAQINTREKELESKELIIKSLIIIG